MTFSTWAETCRLEAANYRGLGHSRSESNRNPRAPRKWGAWEIQDAFNRAVEFDRMAETFALLAGREDEIRALIRAKQKDAA